ncbi:HAD hydrolase-like protein [Corynebacterium halotolerans]|uniref:HAD hydrolase-like protein n=1 Tax=Corynebacterium halotolerans TaxID=225326 RepID=UPI003CF08CFC
MKTLLLDVDGTLVDSFPGIRACFLHALAEVDWPVPDEETISGIAGPPMEQTFRSLGMPEPMVKEAFTAYMAEYGQSGWRNSRPFPQMRELLDGWRDLDLRVSTATSKGESFARRTLQEYGMFEQLDFLGAAQEGGPRRTKAAVIAHVLDSLELRGEESEMLMVGDRSHDIEGAAEFNIPTVAVAWGYGTPEERAEADFIAEDPAELDQLVRAWVGGELAAKS